MICPSCGEPRAGTPVVCLARLGGFPGGLICVRTDPHTDGHVFTSSSSQGAHDD